MRALHAFCASFTQFSDGPKAKLPQINLASFMLMVVYHDCDSGTTTQTSKPSD